MAARRILLTLIGLLSVVILIGSLSAGVLTVLLITNRPVDQKLLVVGPERRLALVDRHGTAQVLADDQVRSCSVTRRWRLMAAGLPTLARAVIPVCCG